MYIDADLIIKAAALLGAVGGITGAVATVYKSVEANRQQSVLIKEIQEEQRILCRGLRGALAGLIEQGCNGPCKHALAELDEHLNEQAHST